MKKAFRDGDLKALVKGRRDERQVLIEFYVDKKLKEEAEEIYKSLGMDLETALRMFMVRSRIEKGFPFEAHVYK